MHRRLSGVGVLAAIVALAGAWQLSADERGSTPGGEPARPGKGGEAPKAPRPLTSAEIQKQLALRMDIKDEALTAPHSLGEVLQYLNGAHGWPPVLLDRTAFKMETPDISDVRETPVQLPVLKGVSRARVLRMLLDAIPSDNATYLIRGGHIEITTRSAATAARQAVHANFVNRPLEEALQELAEQTGLSVVLDSRAAEHGRTPVTAHFRTETSLLTAVRLLADMADLRVVSADNVLYVTLRTNRTRFPPTELFRKNDPAGM
jgi:hypothetical protein